MGDLMNRVGVALILYSEYRGVELYPMQRTQYTSVCSGRQGLNIHFELNPKRIVLVCLYCKGFVAFDMVLGRSWEA